MTSLSRLRNEGVNWTLPFERDQGVDCGLDLLERLLRRRGYEIKRIPRSHFRRGQDGSIWMCDSGRRCDLGGFRGDFPRCTNSAAPGRRCQRHESRKSNSGPMVGTGMALAWSEADLQLGSTLASTLVTTAS